MVSDTSIDIAIDTDKVTENSRNKRPTIPPISSSGINTATSDTLMVSTVKPTSRAPASAACTREAPRSRWRMMFSTTTIASSTTNPVAMVNAINDRLLRL